MEETQNAKNRQLVKESIEQLGSKNETLSREFYRELFRLDLTLKNVFPGNVVTLNRKFSNMLSTFAHLKHLEKVAPSLEQMGDRHFQNYGALIAHFDLFEQALLVAFRATLKDQFTDELEAAWVSVFAEVAEIMKRVAPATVTDSVPQLGEIEVPTDFLEQIGGAEKVMQVHTRFYDVMFADPWLGQFFLGKHESVLAQKQTEFMVGAFGGPNHYEGDTPAFVHMHMFITDDVADYREQLLRDAIRAEGLSDEIADIWLSVDTSFRPGIVKEDISECVMKCRGQMPIKARKPEAMA